MNWLDAVLIFILAASIFTSFRKGLSRELIGLAAVVLALLLGIWFYGVAGSFLIPYLSSRGLANLAGFFIVFFGVMLLGSLISHVVGRFLRVTGLRFIDHALGAGFGVLRGILVAVALVTGIMAFSTDAEHPPQSIVHSRLAPYVLSVGRVANSEPPDMRSENLKSAIIPDDWPKCTNMPRGRRHLSEPRQVSLPTES